MKKNWWETNDWWENLVPVWEFPDDGQGQKKIFYKKRMTQHAGPIDYYAIVEFSDDGYINNVVILKKGKVTEIPIPLDDIYQEGPE